MPNSPHPYPGLLALCRQHQAILVAVSKTRTVKEIEALYQMGQRVFGENRAQELLDKAPLLPSDVEWHLIGHLQTNKVRQIIPHVSCIQSLDSVRLWDKIQEESVRADKKTSCLLQIKIATEETKFGWAFDDLLLQLEQGKHRTTTHVELLGVMGMASLTEDESQVRQEMRHLKQCFDTLKKRFFASQDSFHVVSMGMSGDYRVALEEGSNMIRVGSLLFGPR